MDVLMANLNNAVPLYIYKDASDYQKDASIIH